MKLELLSGNYAICQVKKEEPYSEWISKDAFSSVTETDQEKSIVCLDDSIPDHITKEQGWRLMRVMGVLDFSLIGILSSILEPLAEYKISVFAISTYNTDYIMVKEETLNKAAEALKKKGHHIIGEELF